MTRLAALTGGTGFLGRHVIRALHDEGWQVRMLARTMPHLPELADIPIDLVPGDLTDTAALCRLCTGAEAVIHMAGLVKAPTPDAFMRANRDGTAAVVAAWQAAAPKAHFVAVSSMAAREPHLSDYAASKYAGEQAISGPGDWRILRPGAIYGAHDSESLKVLQLANWPIQPMLNAPDARVAMIDVRDAARAVAAVAGARERRALHELTDERLDGYRWDELASTAARALARPPRPKRLPAFAVKGLGRCGDLAARLTGSAEMLTSAKAREILHRDWSGTPDQRLPAELWSPKINLLDGLTDMVGWARAARRL